MTKKSNGFMAKLGALANRMDLAYLHKLEQAARQSLVRVTGEYDTFVKSKLSSIIEKEGIKPETIAESAEPMFGFDRTDYRVVTFKDLTFGKEKAATQNDLLKVTGIRFYYCNFKDCTFNNIQFENCLFIGCTFTDCFTNDLGAAFNGCNFRNVIPGKKSVDDMYSTFSGCELTAKFNSCDLTQAVVSKSNFYFSEFKDCNLSSAIICDSGFDTLLMSDIDLRGTRIVGTKFLDFTLQDTNGRTKVDRNSFVGELVFDRKAAREVRFARETYGLLNELFENNAVTTLSGEYFYLFKKTELLQQEGGSKLFSYFGLVTCGYGERPFYSLLTSSFVVLACGFLYMLCGVSYNNETLVFHPTLTNLLPDPGFVVHCLHFSLVTFSTVGYGNVTPIGGSLLVSAVEIVIGIIMVGVFVSTLVRKMAR